MENGRKKISELSWPTGKHFPWEKLIPGPRQATRSSGRLTKEETLALGTG